MANSFAPFSRHGLTYSLGFITTRQIIQFYVLFVQNKMQKIICCLLRRKSNLLFRLDILTGKKHSTGLKSTNVLSVTSCQLSAFEENIQINIRPTTFKTDYRNHVQRDLVSDIRGNYFSIIADEYTDASNDEQLTIFLRWVDEILDVHEDFLGFYKVPNIASDTVVSVIKDTFIRLQLSFQYCRGHCYDGRSNMLGKRSGVAKRIEDIQPKAKPTHCHGHSLIVLL